MKYLILLLPCIAVAAWGLCAHADDEPLTVARGGEQRTSLATLYCLDPLSSSISLATGGTGKVFQADGIFNRQSDLDYGNYNKEALTAGIEGGRQGVILDLGTQEALAQAGGYEETVGGGQGFAGLRMDGDRVVGRAGKAVLVDALFQPKGHGAGTAKPVPGHIYLIRITDSGHHAFERIAKVLVVSHSPGDSVTIRWGLMRDVGSR